MSWGKKKDDGTWPLRCDGWCEDLAGEVTMIDEKGYAYCTPCGHQRLGTHLVRKLTAEELELLRRGQPVPSFSVGRRPRRGRRDRPEG